MVSGLSASLPRGNCRVDRKEEELPRNPSLAVPAVLHAGKLQNPSSQTRILHTISEFAGFFSVNQLSLLD